MAVLTARRLRRVAAWVALAAGLLATLVWWMNQPKGWDAEAALKAQPLRAVAGGRVGVVVVALIQPSKFDQTFYDAFIHKLLDTAIPWPVNLLAGRDGGTALADPDNPDPAVETRPARLIDVEGRERAADGVLYIRKWRAGRIDRVAADDDSDGGVGSFIWSDRPGGRPGAAARAGLKARTIYYARLPGGYLPHRDQTLAMTGAAFAKLPKSVVAAKTIDIFNPAVADRDIDALLDTGLDTLVVASGFPILSGFEELRGSYPLLKKRVDAWAARTGRKAPRLLIAPQLGSTEAFAQLWAAQAALTAPVAKPGQTRATLILSLHGLPVRTVQNDPWRPNAEAMLTKVTPAIRAALAAKGWRDIDVRVAQEAFADEGEDPKDELLSVAEATRTAIARRDDLVFIAPVEFLAENTDTLFLHAFFMFRDLPGYRRFMPVPEGIDWSKPFVRRFQAGPTAIVHSGTPAGPMQQRSGAALAEALNRVIPQ